MANKWTDEQWAAITLKDCNLLVAAAAGAGKTAVLVERIIGMITAEPAVDIDKLLVVTFTNAAATEMRERIAAAVTDVLEKNPDNKNIRRQLTLLNKASIMTIHSFCLEVIRTHFSELDIDPNFRIADDTEATLLKTEVLTELFEDVYDADDTDAAFWDLLESYGGNKDDQALQDMVLSVYEFSQSSPWPEQWIRDKVESLGAYRDRDFSATPWGDVVLRLAAVEMEGLKESMVKAAARLGPMSGLGKYLEVFDEDIENMDALIQLCHERGDTCWDDLCLKIQAFTFKTLPRAGKDADKRVQDDVRKVRDNVKKRIRGFGQKYFGSLSAQISADLLRVQPLLERLAGLVLEFSRRYALKKNKKSLLDFNDLEHFCLKILAGGQNAEPVPTRAALSYRDKYDEILVDEYQDSNDVQEAIIRLISRENSGRPNVFMVGDVKQSIYRFRQAKPELFLEKYRTYSMQDGDSHRKLLLYKNFRSRPEVISAVNAIFKQIMSVQVGELEYTDQEALNAGADYPANLCSDTVVGGEVEFHLIETGGGAQVPEYAADENGASNENNGAESRAHNTGDNDGDRMAAGSIFGSDGFGGDDSADDDSDGVDSAGDADDMLLAQEMLDAIQCEARMVAGRIKELTNTFSVLDKAAGGYRQAQYRDIVILLRTTRNWADLFKEELIAHGIPAFTDTGSGFFKTTEVQVMLSLLQILDNPLQDIPLLAVLRSPIFGFTTDELADIRLAGRRQSLFAALQKLAQTEEPAPASRSIRKARWFLARLNAWRELSYYLPTSRLIWHLYSDTGYYAAVGAMPAGEQRQANLRILFDRARQFEESSLKGLFNFVNYVDKLKSSNNDLGSAKLLGENDNVVRIMSIHKSKGLEFPVVILAGCGKKFNFQDMNKSILLHQDLGFGPDIADPVLRLSYPSAPKQAIREKLRLETLSEEMRILYVAMTRAREKLIMTGAIGNAEKTIAKWEKCAAAADDKLPLYQMIRSERYLDWLGPGMVNSGCVQIWNKKQIIGSFDDAQTQATQSFREWVNGEEEIPAELACEIERRLGWQYPHRSVTGIPAKISVTELKKRWAEQAGDDIPGDLLPQTITVRKPLFLEVKKGLSAAERGTVLHFVMQHLDLRNEDIAGQLQTMVEHDFLTAAQAGTVDSGRIRRFLDSGLGRRMLASTVIRREVPFNLELACEDVYPDITAGQCPGETVLLQGVIDCFFEEADGLVLIDYKTDQIPAGGNEALKDRYRLQIAYYAKALERLTQKRVKEKYIYLFSSEEVLAY